MKKKFKKIVFFLTFILFIILLYILFIEAIQKMMPTYENKIMTFANEGEERKIEITNTHVEFYWKTFESQGKVQTLEDEKEKKILQNTTLKAIQSYAEQANDSEFKMKDARKTMRRNKIKDTSYGNLIWLSYYEMNNNRYQYQIIFSEDFKNIALTSYQFDGASVGSSFSTDSYFENIEEDLEKEAEKKETILEIVSEAIEKMQIPLKKEFKPSSIHLGEYSITNLYQIEDEENALSILFDANEKRIRSLTLGYVGIEEAMEENVKIESKETTNK